MSFEIALPMLVAHDPDEQLSDSRFDHQLLLEEKRSLIANRAPGGVLSGGAVIERPAINSRLRVYTSGEA